MLPKSISALYDYLRDFVVYEEAGEIQGICSLYICWDDLAEIRSLAVMEISQVFVLTYQAGFIDKNKQELPHKIWSDCIHCSKFPDCDEDALIHITSSHL